MKNEMRNINMYQVPKDFECIPRVSSRLVIYYIRYFRNMSFCVIKTLLLLSFQMRRMQSVI